VYTRDLFWVSTPARASVAMWLKENGGLHDMDHRASVRLKTSCMGFFGKKGFLDLVVIVSAEWTFFDADGTTLILTEEGEALRAINVP
jgi:hypothetical protein